jgi:hypothetical protein
VLAVFSLAVGAILRRSTWTITLVSGLVIVPEIVSGLLSLDGDKWLNRVTPVTGLAIRETRVRFDTAIPPWAGFGVLCAYTAVALALAFWVVRRRDA